MKIKDTGTLEVGSKTPCPICGADLGYYTEFGDEIECSECGSVFSITHRTEFDFTVVKVGSI